MANQLLCETKKRGFISVADREGFEKNLPLFLWGAGGAALRNPPVHAEACCSYMQFIRHIKALSWGRLLLNALAK